MLVGPSRDSGFSLIELVIVVALAAIVLAIAIPGYRAHVREAQRSEARAALADAAARLDRYFFDNSSYTTDLTQVGYAASPVPSPEGRYTVAAAAGTSGSIATSYVLTATRVDAGDDPQCTTFTLSSQGQPGYTGTAPDLDTCW